MKRSASIQSATWLIKAGCLAIIPLAFNVNPARADIRRAQFSNGDRHLTLETLDDDLMHLEVYTDQTNIDTDAPIYTSPMIAKTDYDGPQRYIQMGNLIETSEIRAQISPQTLCVSFTDTIRNARLTTICPFDSQGDPNGLTIRQNQIQHVYGLGQQFRQLGTADGDWLSHQIRYGHPPGQQQAHGNGFMPFGSAGLVGNIQIPIMYAVGDEKLNYALLLDNVYQQEWAFDHDPWTVQMEGDAIRYYVMTGEDLLDLRQDYLELTGHPPIPPRKAFGLWVSEFGYHDWEQVNRLRTELRQHRFPLDGFVLDLQWFGGILRYDPDSPMGRLDWDEHPNDGNAYLFDDPATHVAEFLADGIGFVTIEESYISENTATFADMHALPENSFLAYQRTDGECDTNEYTPTILNEWFGQGGMVDWSDPAAGEWVHTHRRFPNLVSTGILGHWTDLGEPEKYDEQACYNGVEPTATGMKNNHDDIHNLYNLLWNQSLYEGYIRHHSEVNRRPFILSRSGAPGSQRYGVAMWSGDIGADLQLLATHLNAQMHMSLSGIDYYGSDIGGFRREGMPYNANHAGNRHYEDELYTQWFANGAWFDTPIRPHTDNSFQTSLRYETSPHLVGDIESNLANLRQRYELIPYYYSLAYRAYLFGEPLMPPPLFYYQDDMALRQVGNQKLIGRDLLVAAVARHGEYQRDVYLPQGTWINYHTHDWFTSNGETVENVPTYIDGILRLPTFAKAGAIVPIMDVDDETRDAFGDRLDGTQHEDLMVRVYASPDASEFTLYEDDGQTVAAYENERPIYETRTTRITQQQTDMTTRVAIAASKGTYSGAVDRRNTTVQLVVSSADSTQVRLNGRELPQFTNKAEFDAADAGWYNAGKNLIWAKSGIQSVDLSKTFDFITRSVEPTTTAHFVCDNAVTKPGETVYVTGNIPELGNWDVNRAVALDPNIYWEYIYNPPPNHTGPGPSTPKWTGVVQQLPSETTVSWKCLKRTNSGEWQFEPGENNQIELPESGFAGSSIGEF
ncbi:MAG: TIM-barrel domain-containing protein [Elainellaceae cyanobacterium]